MPGEIAAMVSIRFFKAGNIFMWPEWKRLVKPYIKTKEMITEKKWHAVYTRPKWEKKVADLLTRKSIENYCPLNKSIKQWSDRRKTVLEPLFNSYVFVHVDEINHLPVKQTDGILNFVYWLGKPAVIKNEEIDAIRDFLAQNQYITLEKIAVNINDKVRIIDGSFKNWEGNITEVRSKSVKVMLPSLGYALVAEVPKSRIEVITVSTPAQIHRHNPVLYPAV